MEFIISVKALKQEYYNPVKQAKKISIVEYLIFMDVQKVFLPIELNRRDRFNGQFGRIFDVYK